MDVYYQVKHRLQARTLARKFDISHWLSCGADARAYGHMITKITRMDRLPIFLCFLSGHPLLSGQSLKSPNNCRKEWGLKPLLSGHGHFQAVSTRVLPLLSHLLSDHQALDARSLASFQEYAEGKYSPE